MTAQILRAQYPKFIYEKFNYKIAGGNVETEFFYSIPPDHEFVHRISFLNISEPPTTNHELLEPLIFHLGLSKMFSYWKTTCSPLIEIRARHLSPDQTAFWHKLFIKGMGEYFYKNQIDFSSPDFLVIQNAGRPGKSRAIMPPRAKSRGAREHDLSASRVLIPIGGGKDSIVTLELLKPHFAITPFIINPVPIMLDVSRTAGFPHPVTVRSEIDPYLLNLNRQSYLNGHVPVTAAHIFTSLLAAALNNCRFIAFSNERSSDEGNVSYLGHTINHQYSKTLEFETDISKYLIKNLKFKIKNFSFLRPLYELQITKLFSRYPQYFQVFSSCNTNFKLDPRQHPQSGLWCKTCPKCVSTALLLTPFIGKDKVIEIMSAYPPDLPQNLEILIELLGQKPVKPFECVLTRAEAQAAYTDQGLDKLLSSWLENPNMPPRFAQILKHAV